MYIRRNHSAPRIKRSWNVMLNGKTISLIALLLIGGTTQAIAQGTAREPSETEMRAALQAKLDGRKKIATDLTNPEKCKNPQTPMEATGYLFGPLITGGIHSLSIARFQKSGCECANRGGYWSDYTIAVNTPMGIDSDNVASMRFVRGAQGWMAMDQ